MTAEIDITPKLRLKASPDAKAQHYAELKPQILSVIAGEPDVTARMASVVCLLREAFESYFWAGFYCVDQHKKAMGVDELVIGPYQGSLGCLRIPFSRGVCGAAARTGQTQIVKDVHAIADHIACDPRSQSEIVVPVFDKAGDLIAVFDVDSDFLASFDEIDAEALESLMAQVFSV